MSKGIALQKHGFDASRIVLGCMGLGGGWNHNPLTDGDLKQAHAAVEAALESGITMFDHADIYANGKAEQIFGQVLKERPGLREKIVLQSKCGIRREEPGRPTLFDFSEEHILNSVDGILARLGVESIDLLLLHRPDPLVEPQEVASAFHKLKRAGKVKGFGVSNMSPSQIRLLRTAVEEPLLVNQLELNLLKLDWVNTGVHVNQKAGLQDNFAEGLIEYCITENIQVQSWAPLAKGLFTGKDVADQPDNVKKTEALVKMMAEERDTSPEAIVLAWLMRHPAGIQPVIGTANPERIRACAKAEGVKLSREEWYRLWVTSRGVPMP
jgi:predicted oxidoreductase